MSCKANRTLEKSVRKVEQNLNLKRQCRMSFKNLDHGDVLYARATLAQSNISVNMYTAITPIGNISAEDVHILVIAKAKLMSTNRIEIYIMYVTYSM